MRKKALLKTFIDIFLGVAILALFVLGILTIYHVFVNLPFWFFDLFNLTEKFSNYPMGKIYTYEFLILVFIAFVFMIFHDVYKDNLEQLQFEEKQNNIENNIKRI